MMMEHQKTFEAEVEDENVGNVWVGDDIEQFLECQPANKRSNQIPLCSTVDHCSESRYTKSGVEYMKTRKLVYQKITAQKIK